MFFLSALRTHPCRLCSNQSFAVARYKNVALADVWIFTDFYNKGINVGREHNYFRKKRFWVRVIVFNATFNNITAISWRSVLYVEETGVPCENYRPGTSY